MLFSVLIPLEFHRDQLAASIQKWREQTFDGTNFEILIIASRETAPSDLDAARVLLRPNDRLLLTDATHDAAQVADGAMQARGEILYFTESHVIPSATVLEQCVQCFEKNPDWAGFSCRTVAIAPNRQARAEAGMYESDIHYGMTTHPWRKILDQCFVTKRSAYEAAGRMTGELGHFAEFELAAHYAMQGLKIGYAPEIVLDHFYPGSVKVLWEFTKDFVAGELAYWARGSHTRKENLIDAPFEWWTRGDRRRDLARHLLKIARRHRRNCEGLGFDFSDLLRSYRQHFAAAVTGPKAALTCAHVDVLFARARLGWSRYFASAPRLQRALQNFTSTIAHAGRLAPISTSAQRSADVLWNATPDDAFGSCGIYAGEIFDGIPFRWSQEIAVVELNLPLGQHELHVDTLIHRLTTSARMPAFYFNGRRVEHGDVDYNEGRFTLKIRRREGEGALLAWISPRQPAPGDHRRLGLPIAEISFTPLQKKSKKSGVALPVVEIR